MPTKPTFAHLCRLADAALEAHTIYQTAADAGADPLTLARLNGAAESALAELTALHPSGITAVAIEETDAWHEPGGGWSGNYAWVRRHTLWLPAGATPRQISRAIKAATGYSGVRGETFDSGDLWQFRPYGCAVLVFATFN